MSKYSIHSEVYEQYENFSHIIVEDATQKAVIIDPAWNAEYFFNRVEALGVTPIAIWLTHGHHDHVSAVAPVKERYDIPVYISRVELDYIQSFTPEELHTAFRPLPSDTIPLDDGDIMTLGDVKAKVIHTPGHSAGSVCFLLENDMITGDTLFINGCGRTDLVTSDPEAMFHSLERLKREVPPHVLLHTGHAYGPKATDTMGNQLKSNPFLQYDEMAPFINYRMNR